MVSARSILHAFVAGNFENDAVVINSEAGANDGVAFAEGIVGKTDARAEIFLVGMMMEIDDVGQPDAGAGGLLGEVGARAVIAAGAGGVGIEIPAEAEVDGEVVGDAPIVLSVEGDVAIGNIGNGNRLNRRGAFDGGGDGNVEIVGRAGLAVQIGEAEVRSENDAAAAEDVDFAEGAGVLIFAAEMKSVFAGGPGEIVFDLVTIEVSGFGGR